jgi:DNA primase
MIEGIIFLIAVAWVAKKGVEYASEHWQQARGTNRASTKGQRPDRRAASALRHDTGYWAHQTARGFPELRHGLAAGWHASRTSYSQGKAARAKARTEHLEHHAGWLEELREQRRRQQKAYERIRAARQPQKPPAAEPGPAAQDTQDPPAQKQDPPAQETAQQDTPDEWPWTPLNPQGQQQQPSWQQPKTGQAETSPAPPPASTKGTTTMSGDTNYEQELAELTAMLQDAEEDLNSVQRKRMKSRVDILSTMAVDQATLAEAADIDDALQQQEKAAQQTYEAIQTAIAGLQKRHGGIKQAVDDSPVDKPADPDFYTD